MAWGRSAEQKDGDSFDGGERAASGLSETSFNELLLEEVTHSQHISPLRQVGNIKSCALLLDNPENIIPLACRRAPAHLKPFQFGQDGVFRRSDSHRPCSCFQNVR